LKAAKRALNASGDERPRKAYQRHCRLLCARSERPRCSTAEQRDEFAALHSMTSSATESSVGGTVRPGIRAVWALMTSSNFVTCTTGSPLVGALENATDAHSAQSSGMLAP